ncbi:MAG: GTPase HflX [Myxococcota bacterium]
MGPFVVTPQAAQHLCALATNTGRMMGLLVERRGQTTHVVVGDSTRLYLPDVGRLRASVKRLRALRLVVAKPHNEAQTSRAYKIQADLLGDLKTLHLDAVVQIEAIDHEPKRIAWAVLTNQDDDTEKLTYYTQQVGHVCQFQLTTSELVSQAQTALPTSKQITQPSRATALLIGVYQQSKHIWQPWMRELQELARCANVKVKETIVQQRKQLDPRTLMGKGKVEEVALQALYLGADLLIFDCELAPAQLSAICELTDLKVMDRTMLILDIFARHATSSAGRLQVQLAQLRYCLPRLSRKQSGLSRLTGGIGGQGPGETKLEIDRRRVQTRITKISKQITKLSSQRKLTAQRRYARQFPTVALVGYTNAGKSTLINALAHSRLHTQNKLFATLDTAARQWHLPQGFDAILMDTVGFIRNLPAGLLTAFKATLEHLHEADLLLHLVDASNSSCCSHIKAVQHILEEMQLHNKKTLLVLNKSDQTTSSKNSHHLSLLLPRAITVSALTKKGLDALAQRCGQELQN